MQEDLVAIANGNVTSTSQRLLGLFNIKGKINSELGDDPVLTRATVFVHSKIRSFPFLKYCHFKINK